MFFHIYFLKIRKFAVIAAFLGAILFGREIRFSCLGDDLAISSNGQRPIVLPRPPLISFNAVRLPRYHSLGDPKLRGKRGFFFWPVFVFSRGEKSSETDEFVTTQQRWTSQLSASKLSRVI